MIKLEQEIKDFVAKYQFSDEEVLEAIEDSVVCGYSVIEALMINQNFEEELEYIENGYYEI